MTLELPIACCTLGERPSRAAKACGSPHLVRRSWCMQVAPLFVAAAEKESALPPHAPGARGLAEAEAEAEAEVEAEAEAEEEEEARRQAEKQRVQACAVAAILANAARQICRMSGGETVAGIAAAAGVAPGAAPGAASVPRGLDAAADADTLLSPQYFAPSPQHTAPSPPHMVPSPQDARRAAASRKPMPHLPYAARAPSAKPPLLPADRPTPSVASHTPKLAASKGAAAKLPTQRDGKACASALPPSTREQLLADNAARRARFRMQAAEVARQEVCPPSPQSP